VRDLFNLGDLSNYYAAEAHSALIDCLDWDHPRILSHGEIDRQVNACARALVAKGLARGDRIAILALNRAEVLVAYFAIMRAGFVAIPANIKFPQETVAFVLNDAEVRFAFCDRAGRALLPKQMPLVDFDSAGSDGFAHFLDPGPFEAVRPEAGEAAMVLYTSGSTGRPKGVPLSHDGQLWAVKSRVGDGGHERQRILVAAPFFHMNALGMAKFVIAAGATMVLLPQFHARHYVEAIGRFKVSSLTSVPTMLALALREHEGARANRSVLGRNRAYVFRADHPIADRRDQAGFPAGKANHWLAAQRNRVRSRLAHVLITEADLAIGWPLPGVEVRLVRPDGNDATEGELWIRTLPTWRVPQSSGKPTGFDG
jgi:acyl-CoA synthetase (AMP-forming)/AMP-acid ligase II